VCRPATPGPVSLEILGRFQCVCEINAASVRRQLPRLFPTMSSSHLGNTTSTNLVSTVRLPVCQTHPTQ
jgi:hypothetical protein